VFKEKIESIFLNGVQLNNTFLLQSESSRISRDYTKRNESVYAADAYLDEIKVYNKALNHTQISRDLKGFYFVC
jgi:hypothetical protein